VNYLTSFADEETVEGSEQKELASPSFQNM
jgi:hypothetical protein